MRSGTNARRQASRLWSCFSRRALIAAGVWLIGLMGSSAMAQTGSDDIGEWSPDGQTIKSAQFLTPTSRYAHGVLGDAIEWAGLTIAFDGPGEELWTVEILLPEDHVFEDLHPRLVDLDLSGQPDAVMVIETDLAAGAALALYGAAGEKIAETPHIGRSNRWLAPIGAADLDGDGHIEIAYIDRPHLAKTLRIWRYQGGALTPVADKIGLTNHRIGQDFITSGIRDCGQGPEMITVDAGWDRVMVSRLEDGRIKSRALGPFRGRNSVERALACS